MSERLESWEEVEAFALTLLGTETGMTYRMPTVKVAANGRSFIWTGHEAETSFAMWQEQGQAEMLMDTDPATFWQSAHYAGSGVVLTRYASDDPERVKHVIRQAYEQAAAMKPVRKRAK